MVFEPGSTLTDVSLAVGNLIGRVVFAAARAAAQSISSTATPSSGNALSWDTIPLDILVGWSGANPTRYTPTVAGWYEVSGGVGFVSSTAGTLRGGSWAKSGAAAGLGHRSVVVTNATIANNSIVIPMQATSIECNGTTDYLELWAIQGSGGGLNTNASDGLRPNMIVTYKGPPGTNL